MEEKKKKSIFKKWWFWVIVVVIVIAAVAGGSGSGDDKDKTATSGSDNVASTEAGASTDTDKTAEAGETKDADSAASDVTIEEQVLADQDGVKVTATGIEDSFLGPELQVKIENTSDASVTVQSRNVSVNGIMLSSVLFSSDVAAGKTANDTISFLSSELKAAGIETLGDIQLQVTVIDGETWAEKYTTELIDIPTSAAGTFEQTYDDSGFVAVDQDGIRVIIKKLDDEESFWGADIYVYIENNSEQNVTIQTRDVSINGVMVDPAFSCDVLAGKKAFSQITLFETDLEENNITDITDMELYFTIVDAANFQTILDTDIISVKFE